MGWWGGVVVFLIIVSTPGPVLARNGTKSWQDQISTRLGPDQDQARTRQGPGKDQDLDQELDNINDDLDIDDDFEIEDNINLKTMK